ncbi:MAG: O-antigen ligase family protein [Bryobacterales bacterium]|nr:O-antigen ligase family protein [Bryobacterales bacterium]
MTPEPPTSNPSHGKLREAVSGGTALDGASKWRDSARIAAIGSAIAILVSIPVSQILLGLALLCLLLGRVRLPWPRVWVPLGLFVAWFFVSLAFSPEPGVALPQIKKFYVFLMLPVTMAALRGAADFLRVAVGWALVAGASALLGVGQFISKYIAAQQAGVDFYTAYVAARITGFMSHWMTFSGQEMLVALVLAALLFFGPRRSRRATALGAAVLALLLASIVLGNTRGVWIATAAGALPLLWCYRRWLLLAAPMAFVVVFAVSPGVVQQRVVSIFRPAGELDSNQHRVVTFWTGVEMIKAHPWVGLGPERVGPHVEEYAPAWIRRPFPEGYYGHLHNIYVHYGAERGAPAVLFLLAAFAVLFLHQKRALARIALRPPRARSPERFVHLAVIACLVAILVGGLFEYNLGDSEILTMFFVIAAGGYLATPEQQLLSAEPDIPATNASEEKHA